MATLRPLLAILVTAALSGCADPPGTRKPLPLDYNEQQRASSAYAHIAPRLNNMQGVLGSYVTSHNNPRKIIVVVRDNDTQVLVERTIGTSVDGIPLDFRIPPKVVEDDGPIQPVKTVDLPSTWWGKVLFYLKALPEKFMGLPPPGPPPPEVAPSPAPPAP